MLQHCLHKGPSIYYVIGGGGGQTSDFGGQKISIAKEFLSGGAMTAMTGGGSKWTSP